MLRALFLATLLFVSSRAAFGQELGVLHIKVVVTDPEGKAGRRTFSGGRPVAGADPDYK